MFNETENRRRRRWWFATLTTGILACGTAGCPMNPGMDAGPGTEALVYGGLLRVLWKQQKFQDILQVCRDGLMKSRATNHVLFHDETAKAQARLGRFRSWVSQVGSITLTRCSTRMAATLMRFPPRQMWSETLWGSPRLR